MKTRLLIPLLIALLALLAIAGACLPRRLAPTPVAIWTPVPISGAPARVTPQAAVLPTLRPPPATVQPPSATSAPVQPPTVSLPAPTATSQVVLASPTPDPSLVVIAESDVVAALAGGTAAGGLALEGLTVRFATDQMTLSAARLGYGGLAVSDLLLVGRLIASNGRLEVVTESISPRGLVAALIPVFANQALAQYTAQWYIEEVKILDGKLELRIR